MYESYYGLTQRPFALIPDSNFLFLSNTHKKALSYLIFGLSQQEGFIIITGDVGTGKTLMIQSIMDYLSENDLHGMRIAAANVTASDVLPLMASAFDISSEVEGKARIQAEIELTLLRQYPQGVLLIVDEAQTFTAEALEELRILANMSHHGRALLQIALVGQTDLRYVLNVPNMKQFLQRVIVWHQLESLKINETTEYVKHRLHTAGWIDKPSFEPQIFARLQEWTEGIPRRINILMDRFLLYGYLEEKCILTVKDLDKVINEMGEEFGPPQDDIPVSMSVKSALKSHVSRDSMEAVSWGSELEERIEALKQSISKDIAQHTQHVSEQEIKAVDKVDRNPKIKTLESRINRIENLLAKIVMDLRIKNTTNKNRPQKIKNKSRRARIRSGQR